MLTPQETDYYIGCIAQHYIKAVRSLNTAIGFADLTMIERAKARLDSQERIVTWSSYSDAIRAKIRETMPI